MDIGASRLLLGSADKGDGQGLTDACLSLQDQSGGQTPSGSPKAQKWPSESSFGGRVLFLANDAELIRRQLHKGLDPKLMPELKTKLRDQISTDEITLAYICCDQPGVGTSTDLQLAQVDLVRMEGLGAGTDTCSYPD